MDEENEKTVNVYTRISEKLDEDLRVACARARISKPKAIAEAIKLWLEKFGDRQSGG